MKKKLAFLLFIVQLFTVDLAFAQSKSGGESGVKIAQDVKDVKEAKKKIIDVFNSTDDLIINGYKVKEIVYSDDEIKFLCKKDKEVIFLYKDVIYGEKLTVDASGVVKQWTMNQTGGYTSIIVLSGTYEAMRNFVSNINFIQLEIKKQKAEDEKKRFEPIAAKYRSLAVKPEMSEMQRKHIVQANAMTQQKNYFAAIECYKSAIGVSETDCPDAYSNLALLEAQIYNYAQAIAYMQKYLLLVPDAPDARSAQDKIYEWEINASNSGGVNNRRAEMMNKLRK